MIAEVPRVDTLRIALVGVPNCGKTALFKPPDRQPPEGGELRGRHRRAQGRHFLRQRPQASLPRAGPAGRIQPRAHHARRGDHARRGARAPRFGARAAGARVRAGRDASAALVAARARGAATRPADGGRAQHERPRATPRPHVRPRAARAGPGLRGGGYRGRAVARHRRAHRSARPRHAGAGGP